jgi:hypothetical protein
MGQADKLAPEDMKKAAEEYDDRLALQDTLQEQEEKAKIAQKDMAKLDGGDSQSQSAASEYETSGCGCLVM